MDTDRRRGEVRDAPRLSGVGGGTGVWPVPDVTVVVNWAIGNLTALTILPVSPIGMRFMWPPSASAEMQRGERTWGWRGQGGIWFTSRLVDLSYFVCAKILILQLDEYK